MRERIDSKKSSRARTHRLESGHAWPGTTYQAWVSHISFSVRMSLAGIEPVGFRVKSDLRNHQAIVQPRLYDSQVSMARCRRHVLLVRPLVNGNVPFPARRAWVPIHPTWPGTTPCNTRVGHALATAHHSTVYDANAQRTGAGGSAAVGPGQYHSTVPSGLTAAQPCFAALFKSVVCTSVGSTHE